jgi:hypothetical protein
MKGKADISVNTERDAPAAAHVRAFHSATATINEGTETMAKIIQDLKQQQQLEKEMEEKLNDDAPAEDNRTKEEKFNDLAIPRMEAALDKIRLLGNLSNRSIYAYTDDQIDRMEYALRSKIEEVFKLLRHEKKSSTRFSF